MNFQAEKQTAKAGSIVLVVVVVVTVVSLLILGISVITASVRGRADAYKNKEGGVNRTLAQEGFEDRYANIVAADSRVGTAQEALKADPTDRVAKTNYKGTVDYCTQAVAEYNAEARKYSKKDFQSADLPEQIDETDPKTDCK